MKINKNVQVNVYNLKSPRTGDEVPNQFVVDVMTDKGRRSVFKSYNTIIAVIDEIGCVTLDKNSWDCSATTGKYRNQFLGENIAETRKKIKQGIYTLADLN